MVEIQSCPHCLGRVVFMADGTCPSCRTRFTESEKAGLAARGTLVSENGSATRGQPWAAVDATNPYQSPLYTGDAEFADEPRPPRLNVLSILFSFEGRIPRRIYWGASLATLLAFYAALLLLLYLLGERSPFIGIGIIVLYPLVIWIFLAVAVKRWHDRGRSGWWILIVLVPFIGPILQFAELGCTRGTEGPNQYGPDPT